MNKKCIKALISGRVQGVFFRESTRQQAVPLGISGHAKNLPDGRVEIIAYGLIQHVDLLIEWLQHGPQNARVDSVQIQELDNIPPTGFHTR